MCTAETVLHPNIKVISIKEDSETGNLLYDSWTPSKEEINSAQDILIDEKNFAAVRLANENGEQVMVNALSSLPNELHFSDRIRHFLCNFLLF